MSHPTRLTTASTARAGQIQAEATRVCDPETRRECSRAHLFAPATSLARCHEVATTLSDAQPATDTSCRKSSSSRCCSSADSPRTAG
jgi:hypothetical protein